MNVRKYEKVYVDKNKRHFEERFEDSETDTLYQEINKEEGDQSLGEPIQLIRFPYYGGNISIE